MRKKRIYRKKAKIRNHRVKRRINFLKKKSFWLPVFFFLVFVALIYLLFFSKYFQVNEIKIFGNQKVITKELENLILPKINQKLILPSKSIFLVNTKVLENTILASFSQIDSVKIGRKLPDILVLEIIERKTFAIFCQDLEEQNECFRVDKKGITFDPIRELSGIEHLDDIDFSNGVEKILGKDGLVVYFQKGNVGLGEKIIEPDKLESISIIQEKLQEELKIETEKILILDKRLNVKTKDGFEIYFDLENNVSEQIFNLDTLLKEKIPLQQREELEYIDLRFGNRVYFK